MQPFQQYQQPFPQVVSIQEMQNRLQQQRVVFVLIILGVAITAFLAGFFIERNIWSQWFQNNCSYYPFLLLNPNTHMACTLPTP
jgi:hypothetical protein